MDDEEIRVDLGEAIGKATAAIALQGAIISALVLKGIFTIADVATISGVASDALDAMQGLSEEAKMLGKSTLSGFAQSWTKHLTRN